MKKIWERKGFEFSIYKSINQLRPNPILVQRNTSLSSRCKKKK